MKDLEKKVFLVLNENKNDKNKIRNLSNSDSNNEIEKYV
jgi:hypothetical protein